MQRFTSTKSAGWNVYDHEGSLETLVEARTSEVGVGAMDDGDYSGVVDRRKWSWKASIRSSNGRTRDERTCNGCVNYIHCQPINYNNDLKMFSKNNFNHHRKSAIYQKYICTKSIRIHKSYTMRFFEYENIGIRHKITIS